MLKIGDCNPAGTDPDVVIIIISVYQLSGFYSTRFSDGGEFGFGAEVGISTQKLHARGPLGLQEITSTKYMIYGNGQVRS